MNNNKLLVIGNWKCNPTTSKQAEAFFDSIKQGIGDLQNTEVVICPPFIYLYDIGYPTSNIKFGAQDCFWEQSGAFTGEISPEMLKNLGCEYVILGHSERRQHLKEDDDMIAKKLKAALDAGLKPILCIGETKEQRKQNKAQEILKKQLKILKQIPNSLIINNQLLLAYEPIWAIGTGNTCDVKDAQKVLSFLKTQAQTIIYGGSVDSNNARDYIDKGFDGLLVGNACLDSEEFIKIIDPVEKI